MSATTWTPSALASEFRPWEGGGWRAVEAQHRVASMRLAGGSLADQALLEQILEERKPPVPAAAQDLHWLLSTPFRYGPGAGGSRFRGPHDPGVFYGGEDRETACAEAGYWRLRFWRASAGLRQRQTSLELTLFQWFGAASRSLDLSSAPLSADSDRWMAPDDYAATQELARAVRAADGQMMRYRSVRRAGGYCLAVLTPAVFRGVPEPYRRVQQTWTLTLVPPLTAIWQRHLESEAWEFRFEA